MTKRKSEPEDKHQHLLFLLSLQTADDKEIKKHIRQGFIDLAGKLKCLAARFEACGFMPSTGQLAKQIVCKAADVNADITFEVWLGEDGKKYASRKTLSLDDTYAKDLLWTVDYLIEEKYLRNADPQQASIEMMKIADVIQKDLISGTEVAADLSETKGLKIEGSLPSDSESTVDSLQNRKWEELDKLDHYLVELYKQWKQKLERDKKARFPSLRHIAEMLKRHSEIEPELELTPEGVRARIKKLAKEPWLPEYPYHRHAKRKTKETPYAPDHIEDMLDKDEAHPLE